MNCPECQAVLPADSRFCDSCGTEIQQGPHEILTDQHPKDTTVVSEPDGRGGSSEATSASLPQIPAARSPWPGTEGAGATGNGATANGATANGQRQEPAARTALSRQFFAHAAGRPTGRPSNPTRYLCAAAYLDPGFANKVIEELLSTHRAVAPSVDIDLGPVIRHCVRARRIAMIRDIVLTVLVVGGLFLALLPMIAVAIIALGLAFLRGPAWQRRSVGGKARIVTGVVVVAGVLGLIVVASLVTDFAAISSPVHSIGTTLWQMIVILALVGITEAIYTNVKYRTLSDHLRPGATPADQRSSDGRFESRISQVEAAQWGNVTLYSGENPFVGTGQIHKAWSIAIELERVRGAGYDPTGRLGSASYVPIDPVELHKLIRERLLRLNDDELPENERISALTVADHVVGEGLPRWDGPLIDPAEKVPYSEAAPAAIEALIRHPQAGMRYYQRISVSDEGQAVLSDGEQVISGTDQEVAVSAFVYVAVEGRMFYVEFVTTVLPPIRHEYHMIDRMPTTTSGSFLAKVLGAAATTMFIDLISAVPRILGTLLLLWREQRSFAEETAQAQGDYIFGDVGIRRSVRELGSVRRPHTHIQALDVAKYTKIVERLLTDTVLAFLHDKGADVTDFASSAATVVNAAMINFGSVSGPVAASATGPVTQTIHQAS